MNKATIVLSKIVAFMLLNSQGKSNPLVWYVYNSFVKNYASTTVMVIFGSVLKNFKGVRSIACEKS